MSKSVIDIYDDDIKNHDRVQLSASAVTINCHYSEIGKLISQIETTKCDVTALKLELANFLIDQTTNRMYTIAENKAGMK